MKIAILGCGPAGLLAAYAAQQNGHQPTVFSRKVKSEMPGAQYIHEQIPGLTGMTPMHIKYMKLGTKEGYAEKVYGSPDAPCSWDAFPEGVHLGYNMTRAYDELWERYGAGVLNAPVDQELLAFVQQRYDMVISTVPATLLCYGDCDFRSQRVWIRKQHRDICEQVGDPVVIYNGQGDAYYRTSLIAGHGYTEYGKLPLLERPNTVFSGAKPLSTTCRCRPNILRAGRFGEWRKGVLVHDAYHKVMRALV